jgi:hypothetical protein
VTLHNWNQVQYNPEIIFTLVNSTKRGFIVAMMNKLYSGGLDKQMLLYGFKKHYDFQTTTRNSEHSQPTTATVQYNR